jgi:L-iditol 2-dehydrogenase
MDTVPALPEPGEGEITIRVGAVGVCGSDLHMYETGRIGTSVVESPLILGHEFMGEVIAVGANATDGLNQPLRVGQRVAVDPATPCYRCEICEQGHPNLCPNHTFYGVYPDDGALREQMTVHARNAFPMPEAVSDGAGALLETLGVAIHAVDLGHLKIAQSVAIIGCGPVGLLILRLAKLAGAYPIYAFDCFSWRVEKARAWGATHAWTTDEGDAVQLVMQQTHKRGVDVVFEAARADQSIQQAMEMATNGGRVVLVGIPGDDNLQMRHSTARRKGLTIMMSRRMKHTYPRAITLATMGEGVMPLDDLVSHVLPLKDTPQAYQMNATYADNVHKIVVKP